MNEIFIPCGIMVFFYLGRIYLDILDRQLQEENELSRQRQRNIERYFNILEIEMKGRGE